MPVVYNDLPSAQRWYHVAYTRENFTNGGKHGVLVRKRHFLLLIDISTTGAGYAGGEPSMVLSVTPEYESAIYIK